MSYFILGRSGGGQSELIHKYIAQLPPDKKAILIVPEQSSFYNEKKILKNLGEKGAKNIEVLSFRRLCTNIFDEYKGTVGQRIDDGIKAVLMSMAVENTPAEGGELELYGKKSKGGLKKTMDIVDPMLVAVNEYKMCMISPEMLFDAARNVESKVLASKLRDSARIYAAYNALLENTYEDPDDDLVRLDELLGEHNVFGNITVFIDSFTGFSAQEMKIIERIFSQAEDVYISLCCDRETISKDTSIFAESNITYRKLLNIAQKTGHICKVTECNGQSEYYKSSAVEAVEKNLFLRYRNGENVETAVNDGTVEMFEGSDIYDEIDHTAKRIYHLVNNCGYKYSDIEVIGRDIDNYKSVIRSEFPKYNIPYFLSDHETLENKAFIRMILSIFDIIHSGYDTEAIFRYAKTGFSKLEDSDIFELENYVYIWSIRGQRWKQPFTMSPDGIRSEHDKDEEIRKETENLENLRVSLITPLIEFEKSIKSAVNGGDITKAIYRFIEMTDCKKSFRNLIYYVRKHEGEIQAERESGVWDKTMNILDKMYTLLKDKPTDSRSYLELLNVYIRKTPVSDIPRTVNSVTVGIAGAIRSEEPKAVFAVGCNEGVFPAQPSAFGIFTDSERRLLREECEEENRLPLYDSIFGNSLKEKYNVYATLSAPAERLYISWHTQGLSGGVCEPSVVKNEITAILPDTKIIHSSPAGEDTETDEILFTERQGFDLCADLWNENTELSSSLKEYFLSSEKYSDRADAIGRSVSKEPFALKNIDGVKKMFGSPLRLSSTKIDQFASCKFAYFCKFGLSAYPIRKASMDGGLYGSAMHYIFEKLLSENKIEDFVRFDDAKLKGEIKKYLEEFIVSLGDKEERDSRFNAICSRIQRNAFKTLNRMRKQFTKDSFRPVDFELRIGADDDSGIPAYELILPTGEKVIVSGYVDRVDAAVWNDKKYIRIIDYKTGNDEFTLSNIANGIKMQMLLYLSAIMKNGTERYSDGKVMLPAGVLYVPSTPISKAASSGSEQALNVTGAEEDKKFKMSGLLLEDKDVLRLMEKDLAGEFIPAALTKKNEFNSYSRVVAEKDFNMIFNYIDTCIKSMAEELYTGNIEVFPEKHACQYCDYKSICRFETGDAVRELIRYSNSSALQAIKGEKKEDDV